MPFAIGARGFPAVARATWEPRYEDLKKSFTKGKLTVHRLRVTFRAKSHPVGNGDLMEATS